MDFAYKAVHLEEQFKHMVQRPLLGPSFSLKVVYGVIFYMIYHTPNLDVYSQCSTSYTGTPLAVKT
jgi:hypothetical protein